MSDHNPVSISVKNIGPVPEFEYSMKHPGLYVVMGPNGSGKSTIERTIELATTGSTSQRLEKRDGTPRGEAEIAGVTIRVNKQVRIDGELSVLGLSDLSLSDLCEPLLKEPVTRDAARIKALNKLSGTKADASLFYELVGGKEEFNKLVKVDTLTTPDLVEMTLRIKAAFEEAARAVEDKLRTAEADARAQQQIADGIDVTAPHDETSLQNSLESAIQVHTTVQEKRRVYRDTIKASDRAKEELEKLPPGKSVEDAKAAAVAAEASLDAAKLADAGVLREIETIEQQLREAKLRKQTTEQASTSARLACKSAEEAVGAATRDIGLRGQLDAAIKAAVGAEETTEDDVDNALEATGIARKAVTLGATVRQAIKARKEAELHLEKAAEFRKKARRLRDAASDTMTVLANSISSLPNCPLSVKADDSGKPRLVLKTDRADDEYYDQLSDGEKWAVAIKIAARARRLIPLSQGAYGELAESLRSEVNELAKQNDCYIITSLAVDCALHAEPYEREIVVAAE